jgi:O-antigen ligase
MQIIVLGSILLSVMFLVVYGAGIYSWSVLLAAVCLLVVSVIAGRRQRVEEISGGGLRRQYAAVYVAIIGFTLLMLLPLPKSLTVVTGNARYQQNCVAAEIVDQAVELGACGPIHYMFSTTRNRAGTLRVLLLIVAVFSMFSAAQMLSLKSRLICLNLLVLLGVTVAVLGYLSYSVFPQDNRLWWLFSVAKSTHRHSAGCFLNINHYAGFVALFGIGALGTALVNLRARRWWLALFAFVAAGVMCAAVTTATSRGALLALGSGLSVLFVMVVFQTRGWLRIAVVSLLMLVMVGGVMLAFNSPKVRARIVSLRHPESDPGGSPRLNAWGGAWRLWKSYPVVGVGANAFRFGYLQTKDTQNRKYRRFAENEVLQVLSEGGVVGIALVLLLLLSLLWVLFGGILQAVKLGGGAGDSGDSGIVGTMAGCGMAVLATALAHSMFDFILHLPLYAMAVALFVGLSVYQPQPLKSLRRAVVLSLVVALCLLPLLKPLTYYDRDSYTITASNNQLARLMMWSPMNTVVWRRLGANLKKIGTPEADRLVAKILKQVTEYDPTNFTVWINLGEWQLSHGDKAGAKISFTKAKSIRSWAPVPKLD